MPWPTTIDELRAVGMHAGLDAAMRGWMLARLHPTAQATIKAQVRNLTPHATVLRQLPTPPCLYISYDISAQPWACHEVDASLSPMPACPPCMQVAVVDVLHVFQTFSKNEA